MVMFFIYQEPVSGFYTVIRNYSRRKRIHLTLWVEIKHSKKKREEVNVVTEVSITEECCLLACSW